MFERFTDRARKAVATAQQEARDLDHNFIGTEHVLLGLIVDNGGIAERALGKLGVDADQVRAAIVERVGRGKTPVTEKHVPFTPRAKKVLELSLREALQLGHNYIGTEHLLLGLTRADDRSVAIEILESFGIETHRVRAAVIDELREYRQHAGLDVAEELVAAVGETRPRGRRSKKTESVTGPACPGCAKDLSAWARYTTWNVPELSGRGSAPVLFLFCSACGHTIDDVILPSE